MAISANLGLELATVSNFFMNARRRSMDKWLDGFGDSSGMGNPASNCSSHSGNSPHSPTSSVTGVPTSPFDLASYMPQNCINPSYATEVKAEPF